VNLSGGAPLKGTWLDRSGRLQLLARTQSAFRAGQSQQPGPMTRSIDRFPAVDVTGAR